MHFNADGQAYWQAYLELPPRGVMTAQNALSPDTAVPPGSSPQPGPVSADSYSTVTSSNIPRMSFGWSAGDIAAAIKLAHSVYEALDSCRGAAREYREAASFLKEITHTLEPLKSFAAWGAYPVYGKEISDRVVFIKEPVENLLREIDKLEPTLGLASKTGHHRHVFPKLKWRFFISKRVLELRAQIQSHMRVLDTLLQRLTL